MFINGKIFALLVKTLFTGKLVNQFYRFLPVKTSKNSHLYLQGTARAGLMHERPRARGHDREIRLPLQDLRRF